jgi:ribosomal RNA-processing protein 9
VTSAVVSNDTRFLFTSGKEGSIIKWDLHNGTRLATFRKLRPGGKGKERAVADLPGHSDAVLTLALSDDGRYLASAGKDRRVGVWDVEKGEWVRGFGGHRDTISVCNPPPSTGAAFFHTHLNSGCGVSERHSTTIHRVV